MSFNQIPNRFRSLLDKVVREARQNVHSSRTRSDPYADIVNLATNQSVRVALSLGSESEQERSAETLRFLAREHAADAVILVMESWTLPKRYTTEEGIKAAYDQYGSIAAHPERLDVISFMMECSEGYWMGRAPILTAKGTKTRTFLAVNWIRGDEAKSLFSSLLPGTEVRQVMEPTISDETRPRMKP